MQVKKEKDAALILVSCTQREKREIKQLADRIFPKKKNNLSKFVKWLINKHKDSSQQQIQLSEEANKISLEQLVQLQGVAKNINQITRSMHVVNKLDLQSLLTARKELLKCIKGISQHISSR